MPFSRYEETHLGNVGRNALRLVFSEYLKYLSVLTRLYAEWAGVDVDARALIPGIEPV